MTPILNREEAACVCLGMNSRGQLLLNLGITLAFGLYGVISATYTEMIKPRYEWSGRLIAFDMLIALVLATIIGLVIGAAFKNSKDDSELKD